MSQNDLSPLNTLFNLMPPVQAMQIQALQFDGEQLAVMAPLSANVNDKACAFGGSLVSVMTIAAWGLLNEKLRQATLTAEVYIADTQVKFLKPLYENLQASAHLAADCVWSEVLHVLQEKRRARAFVTAQVQDVSGQIVARMTAKFALIQAN